MMYRASILLAGAAAFGLSGCTGSTDPATASLFDNINNLQTGVYDRQIAAKDAEAAAIIANNRASQARISGLEAQSASNSRNIAALRSQIAAVRGQASAARSQISADPSKIARLNQLEGQIRAIEADANGGGDPGVAGAELRRVSSAIRALTG